MVCLPVLVFLFAVECQVPSDTELPMCSQAMCSADPHRLLVAGEGGQPATWQRHGHQPLGALPAIHLPSASRVTCGRGVEPGVSTAWVYSPNPQQTGEPRSIVVRVPGCAWPTEHTAGWPAQGRVSRRHARPQDATNTHMWLQLSYPVRTKDEVSSRGKEKEVRQDPGDSPGA